MGVVCPDVRVVIHLSPPDDIDSYIQETGRVKRNGLSSQAILYKKKAYPRTITQDMKIYCQTNTECCRYILFNKIEGYKSIECM